jgi:DNA-directed RNA polymerase subunit M/transcription elongation factor TFIIS
MNDTQATTFHGCYRCGKEHLEQGTFRVLPGSTHITLCPACYEVIWGWHEHQPRPAPEQKHQQKAEAASE